MQRRFAPPPAVGDSPGMRFKEGAFCVSWRFRYPHRRERVPQDVLAALVGWAAYYGFQRHLKRRLRGAEASASLRLIDQLRVCCCSAGATGNCRGGGGGWTQPSGFPLPLPLGALQLGARFSSISQRGRIRCDFSKSRKAASTGVPGGIIAASSGLRRGELMVRALQPCNLVISMIPWGQTTLKALACATR